MGKIYTIDEITAAVKPIAEKYGIDKLCYYEVCPDMLSAIGREKELKKLRRKEKLELIEINNPDWFDLYYKIVD